MIVQATHKFVIRSIVILISICSTLSKSQANFSPTNFAVSKSRIQTSGSHQSQLQTTSRAHLSQRSLIDQQQPKVGLAAQERLSCNVLSGSSLSFSDDSKIDISSKLAEQTKAKPQDGYKKLERLKQLMATNSYDGYLITPNDEHLSQQVADSDRRLLYISEFTGTNGFALILANEAVFFTDGRYALQAEKELDCNWSLVVGASPLLDIVNWLKFKSSSTKGIKIATDARLMSLQMLDYLEAALKPLDIEFALISQDLVDAVRLDLEGPNRFDAQKASVSPLYIHPLIFNGNISWQEKVAKLSDEMNKLKASHYIVSALDDIAWLLNLRGADIPMSPLFKSYMIVSRSQPLMSLPSSTDDLVPLNSPQRGSLRSLRQLFRTTVDRTDKDLPNDSNNNNKETHIYITLFVDFKKLTQQVKEHLCLSNGTLFTVDNSVKNDLQNSAIDETSSIEIDSLVSPYQFERYLIGLKVQEYDSFIDELKERLSRSSLLPQQEQQTLNNYGLTLSGRLLLSSSSNVAIHVLTKQHDDRLILTESIINKLKAIKTDSEVAGMRNAHWRDSLAISMLLTQLDIDIGTQGLLQKWTETSAAKELELYKSLMDNYISLSFSTASAYGSNSAIIHYNPDNNPNVSQAFIGNQSTYLLDSGSQYLDGTTDITRTAFFGSLNSMTSSSSLPPLFLEQETYTRVLMGAIDMMSLVFMPAQRPPFKISDIIARRYLHEIGLDYPHGTGHGIGLFMQVHEKPDLISNYQLTSSSNIESNQQQVSSNQKLPSSAKVRPQMARQATHTSTFEQTLMSARRLEQPAIVSSSLSQKQNNNQNKQTQIYSDALSIQPNMFTSVEPGYYKPGEFGIRLENIVVTQKSHIAYANNAYLTGANRTDDEDKQKQTLVSEGEQGKQLLNFEPISMVPFEPKLIKYELMSNKQKMWLNSYNLMVRFRMTQEINSFLQRIRQYQQQKGINSLSVLGNNSSTNDNNIGRNNNSLYDSNSQQNFVKFGDLDLLKTKLEQTHAWIMSKTELIPLDVPQNIIKSSPNSQVKNQPSSLLAAKSKVKSLSVDNRHNQQQVTELNSTNNELMLSSDIESKILMLAYMSSLPFSDVDAASEASLALAASSLMKQQISKKSTNENPNALQMFPSKCQGVECDLLVVSAMSPQLSAIKLTNKQISADQQVPSTSLTQRGSLVPSNVDTTGLLNTNSTKESYENSLIHSFFELSTILHKDLSHKSPMNAKSLDYEASNATASIATTPGSNFSPFVGHKILSAANLNILTVFAICILLTIQFGVIVFLCRNK